MRSRKRRRKMIRQWRYAGFMGVMDMYDELHRRRAAPVSDKPLNLDALFDQVWKMKRERAANGDDGKIHFRGTESDAQLLESFGAKVERLK